ncbi:zinc-ribbon domain protein [Citrobacter phage vB_CfrS_K1M]
MANVEASWCVSLIVECPGCGKVMDLTENDNVIDGTFCSALENEKDYPVECPECGNHFTCDFAY